MHLTSWMCQQDCVQPQRPDEINAKPGELVRKGILQEEFTGEVGEIVAVYVVSETQGRKAGLLKHSA